MIREASNIYTYIPGQENKRDNMFVWCTHTERREGVESCENTCGDMFSYIREGKTCEDERVNSLVDGKQLE